jgi:hypothetical protein
VPITPDDKDWTWVLDRVCPECGFDASTFPATGVADGIRANADEWQAILTAPAVALRQRPDASTWSPLEYACHVRDVFQLYDFRLGLILDEDDPTFPNWDQDLTAVEDRYNEQDQATVASVLGLAAGRLADHFDQVGPDQWSRTGNRSDGARFTVDTFSRYLLHDPVHHVWDARRPSANEPVDK